PEDTAPRYLSRDRDGVYGSQFRTRVQGMDIQEVLTAARSPWQSVRGTTHRQHSPRVPQSCDCARRTASEMDVEKDTFGTTSIRGPIYPWRRIRRTRDRFKHWKQDVSSKSLKSAVCTIVTSVAPPELKGERRSTMQER